MSKISFCFFDWAQSEDILPQMFDILFTNMSIIALTGNSYEEDKQMWLSSMTAEQGKEKQILLMYVGEILAGYFQYRIDGNTMMIEEIEIVPDYQRTVLFYHFLKFIADILPKDIVYVNAYINKYTSNSQQIAEKLGMKIVGENKSGRSWRYQGKWIYFKRYLK